MKKLQSIDPRYFQIASLGALVAWGGLGLGLDLRFAHVAAAFAGAIGAQAIGSRWAGIPFEAKSAFISALSIIVLLRAESWLTILLAAGLAVGSKFILRIDGRHVFNPTNIAIVAVLATGWDGWVSSGRWGSETWTVFLIACGGVLVVHRAARSDVTWAFLLSWTALVFGRAIYLGDPLAIPLHQLQNGTLLIFSFFMISDPKTTPDSRIARILWAVAVAALAGYLRFHHQQPNALLLALAFSSPFVPVLNRLIRARRFEWPGDDSTAPARRGALLTPLHFPKGDLSMIRISLMFLVSLTLAMPAFAFCGFYVGKAGSNLYNNASKAVLVRDGDRTVITMANDYEGDLDEFAIVIPVPTVIQRSQINLADPALLERLDTFTAPRLVEYHDENPCQIALRRQQSPFPATAKMADASSVREEALGVTVEASYSIGEYEIVVLSAKQSDGLQTWLRENGYRIPEGATATLQSYIRQNTKFFVARVNIEEQRRLGFTYLRPIQIAFETPKFMLPIRLGTVNARGPQDLIIHTLTRKGRVETTNYRTVRIPTDAEVPMFVRDEFGEFYSAMFDRQVREERMRAVFLEYAWNAAWCDPCPTNPLTRDELRALGVFWLDGGGPDVFVTRLHVRYDARSFPEDLVFQETNDQSTFQARYIVRHPWEGREWCSATDRYRRELAERERLQARTAAQLTGWPVEAIFRRMDIRGIDDEQKPWWEQLWDRF
ncbi:MAG: DUF2330 domain-containing protein [Acidobacteria bacterium]|nr:DUF2330 domain-containing protein [Acidobacteriota bacterium]